MRGLAAWTFWDALPVTWKSSFISIHIDIIRIGQKGTARKQPIEMPKVLQTLANYAIEQLNSKLGNVYLYVL